MKQMDRRLGDLMGAVLAIALIAIPLTPLFATAQEGEIETPPVMDAPAQAPMEIAAAPVEAPEEAAGPAIDTGDTAWILTSTALVLLMTVPGVALFYGGMVRKKNVLGTMMHSLTAVGVVTLVWVLWGYSLSFGPDVGGLIGSLAWFGLSGVGLDPSSDYGTTIPHQLFMVFQMMFAIITAALISGAVAERMKFSAFVIFLVVWITIVYAPVAHWVWGIGGWIGGIGALDFAGGTVVHILSGVSGLAAAIAIGKRKGYGQEHMGPHNLPLVVIGASLLWFGWFGFNAGSALGAGASAAGAFVVTQIATAAAVMAWIFAEWIHRGKPSVLGAATGAVAGLVAITPAAGFVGPISSIWIGIGAAVICYYAILLKNKLGYDDSLDAFGVHGVGGSWGAIATGLFASDIGGNGKIGLFFGNAAQLVPQVVAVIASWAIAFIGTFVIIKVIDMIVGVRVTPEEEQEGLDLAQHDERGYIL